MRIHGVTQAREKASGMYCNSVIPCAFVRRVETTTTQPTLSHINLKSAMRHIHRLLGHLDVVPATVKEKATENHVVLFFGEGLGLTAALAEERAARVARRRGKN